ncbi:hypothetical protein Kfla_4585 [Kribbella flavida DSM 17836]|uniref:Lipoprotein n=1 Tax=Kribbella flavida (strain DSM 17836 / JCM 10339 / NBRC 14399) TaxID=479435 RepID=D2PXZ7_KRIFD|nr:hypothetical protein [Kribbella flavida]ADB33603.1 hypothetical protein Kfla_4585 [Kribbella flavida DSM 17836]
MRIRDLAVTATLIPVLMLAGCGADKSADVAASAPGAHKAAKPGASSQIADASGQPGAPTVSDDPIIAAYHDYRVALDTMMRSGGRTTKQLVPVMTPELYRSISQQAKFYRTKKLRNTGATRVIWAKRTVAAAGVLVRACYDTLQARTVDAKGRSVLPAKTPTRWVDEMRIEQHDGRWVVDGGRTLPQKC